MIRISNFSVILFVICYLVSGISTAYAVESSPSADIRSKLDALKAEIASKAAKLKVEVNNKLQNRAYVGAVKTKSIASLALSGTEPKIINVNQDTVFVTNNKKVKTYSFKAISEGDYLAALGDIDDTGALIAKKVILQEKPKTASKSAVWGQVLSSSDNLLTIKNRELKNVAVSLAEIALPNIKNNDFVIVSGVINKNDILEASFVYILPQGILLKPKTKPATPSATAVSSSSAKTKK